MVRRDLRGARAIVTGASSGIGKAIALELARRGARLTITARSEDRLRQTAARVEEAGSDVETVVGDVTDEEIRRKLIVGTVARYGGIDLLVNNAGVGAFGRFEEAK